ncbi:putative methyltransferase-like protein 15 isoform X2, partial [Clarias magur]
MGSPPEPGLRGSAPRSCLIPDEDDDKGTVVLDLTFGGGGHSKAILRSVPDVTLVAVDRDPVAFRFAQQLAEEYPGQVKPVLGRFSELKELFNELGLGNRSVDAALLDAGCSSMQMDMAERGFSLSKDGPLDMRMDADRYPGMPCAADAVSALDQRALACVLAAYGEEQHAKKIAAAIVQARSLYPISRTQQLASIVAVFRLLPSRGCKSVPSDPHNNWHRFSCRMLFLMPPSHLIRAWDRHLIQWIRSGLW